MTQASFQSSSNQEVMVAIEIIPVEEEKNEKVIWASVEQMYIDIGEEVSHLKGYSAKYLSTGNRGAEILLIGAIADAIPIVV